MKSSPRDSTLERRGFLRECAGTIFGLAWVLSAGPLALCADDGSSAWNKLSDSEKAAIEKRWADFKKKSPAEQAELRRGFDRYTALTADQKKLVDNAYARWKGLTAGQRQEIREKFLQWKKLTAEEQSAVRDQVRKTMMVQPAK